MTALILAALLSSTPSLAGTTFYVAKDGNDAWSGRLPTAKPGKSDGPLATLEKARDLVRQWKSSKGLAEPIAVLVRGGVYRLPRTLRFTAEDSGTTEFPVTYQASPGETVVLTGARPVRGWKPYRDKIYLASLPQPDPPEDAERSRIAGDVRFRELFYQGRRQILARFPNLDPAHPVTGGLLYVDDTASSNRNSFHYAEGSIPFGQWQDISQAEVNIFPYHCWDHNILRVAKVDREINLVTLRHNVAGSIFTGNRYFVQNVLGALDAPGEWFCDYETRNLYFHPPAGTVPGDDDVETPMIENLVELSGSPQLPVAHLRFHGFTLRHARQDAIAMEGARDCRITGNTIAEVGGVGINAGYLRNASKGIGLPWRKPGLARAPVHSGDRALLFSHFCQCCRIAGNDVESVGGDGIVLGGDRNTADNNHLYRTGTYDRVCAAITIVGEGNVASHNTIHDVPRDGIFINGKDNLAEYNEIRNSMLYTADNAAIALRQHDVHQAVKNRGNVIRYNRLLDVIGYGSHPHCTHPGDGFASPFCSFGIYLDASISGVTVYGNTIARCGGNSLFIQFGGGNVVENNIFVEGDARRLQFDSMIFFGTFMFTDRAKQYNEPPNQIRRNIFCYGGADTKLYQLGPWDNAPEWDRKQAVFDENLIWRFGRPVAVWLHKTLDCKSLAEWQARGHDTRSVVADPLFVDPRTDDYRLKPESPAYRVGFKNINAEIEKIGAYASSERARWPLANAVLARETPLVFEFSKEPAPLIDGFELVPAGSAPGKMQVAAQPPAGAAVSSDAARIGRQSLKFIDAPGLKNPWEPHAYCHPNYRGGKIHFGVDLMNDPQAPADFYMEFRDWAAELLVGPSFRVTRDGKFYAGGLMGTGGKPIAEVPAGQWYHVEIAFELGQRASKQYQLSLSLPGRKPLTVSLPFGHAAFRQATWFGISSTSNQRALFYVDNFILGPSGSEKVQRALDSPAIKGRRESLPKPPSAPAAPDMLVGYWKFEQRGDELIDCSGNGLGGELGGVERAAGPFGKALHLDGSGTGAVIPDRPLLHFGTGDFSLQCWIQPLVLEIASQHPRRRLIEKGGYPGTWWNVDLWSDGRVMMEMADERSASGTTTSSGVVPKKTWTQLTITVDRKNHKTRYYFNGKLDSVKDVSQAFVGKLDVAGSPLSTGTWQQFMGLIAELKIYRRLLADGEIAASHEREKGRYVDASYTVIPDD